MKLNPDKFECLNFWPGRTQTLDSKYKGPDGAQIEEKNILGD